MIAGAALLKATPLFCRKLRQAIDAGTPLQVAIDALILAERGPFRQMIVAFNDRLKAGDSFYTAMADLFPKQFPLQVSASVSPPNVSLFLADCESYLLAYSSQVTALKKQLAYPVFLLGSLGLLFWVFYSVLLPNYVDFFSGMGLALPAALSFMLNWQTVLFSTQGFVGFLLCFSGLSWFVYSGLRWSLQQYDRYICSKFLKLLGVLLNSGVSTKTALLSMGPFRSKGLKKRYAAACETIGQDGQIDAFISNVFLLNAYQSALLHHAVVSGQLATSLSQVSADMEESVFSAIQRGLLWVQPVLLLAIASVIFLFIQITFLPIFQSISQL